MEAPRAAHKVPWPPLIALAALAAGIALQLVVPLPWFGPPLSDILFAIGWLAALAAALLLATAVRALLRARTTIHPGGTPDHLVTDGPFALSRNPIYLANALAMIGIGLITGIAWLLPAGLLAGFVTQKVAIEKEERILAEKFGRRYRDYARRVRRWI